MNYVYLFQFISFMVPAFIVSCWISFYERVLNRKSELSIWQMLFLENDEQIKIFASRVYQIIGLNWRFGKQGIKSLRSQKNTAFKEIIEQDSKISQKRFKKYQTRKIACKSGESNQNMCKQGINNTQSMIGAL